MLSYAEFVQRKTIKAQPSGFDIDESKLSERLFPFQRSLVRWALNLGRGAIFADCGLGKTPMQLEWARTVMERENERVLILTPLAVSAQTVQEGAKFGVEVTRSRDGALPAGASIVVTNYEQLHRFDPADFVGVVCDESSILKHYRGATQEAVTRFMARCRYRLLCTATAAPNDYVELGTSSEALGGLTMLDMLARFFKQDPKVHTLNERERRKKMALRGERADARMVISGTGSSWRLKGHAATPFWRWVASWARACRKPSDLGFDDAGFSLPPLNEREHIIEPTTPPEGMLFPVAAFGLREEREERRRTMEERIALAAQLVKHDDAAVVWCHLNDEGNALVRGIPGAVQVRGSDSDEAKEEAYQAFAAGAIRVLVTKPKIGAFGLNWQHCAHVVTFASHSFEQYYQSVRRCWRFGQTRPVTVDIIATIGEQHVMENMQRKARAASLMFEELVGHMNNAERAERRTAATRPMEVPSWL